jgi:hypothetical protein
VSRQLLLPIQPLSLSLDTSIGKEKGRIPWAKLKRAQDDFIDPKYLPKNLILKQFHHLHQDNVNAILNHWMERQAAGKVPFQFKKVNATWKNKHTLEKSDADTNMESGKEAEEDLQSGDDNQEQGNGDFQGQGSSNSSNEHALPGQGLGNATENPRRVGWFLIHNNSRC